MRIESHDDTDETEVDASQSVHIGITLKQADKDIILSGDNLTDEHINTSQKVLAKQFLSLTGFDLTIKLHCHGKWTDIMYRCYIVVVITG